MYRLSNRQLKELHNGKQLRIAIPYPDDGIPGCQVHHDLTIDPVGGHDLSPMQRLIDWSADQLGRPASDVDPDWIRWAALQLVPVNPCYRGAGLSELLGTIVGRQNRAEATIVIRILCVVITISERERPRGEYPTQWPLI